MPTPDGTPLHGSAAVSAKPKPTSNDERAPGTTATSTAPNHPLTMRPLHDPTATPAGPKPILNNMPTSVENLFPLISVATPCGNNRNLQQENHSNFIVAYPPPTS